MNKKISLMETCLTTAFTYHMGQVDKNGRPYILHPFAVASMMDTEEEIILAVMHDTIEDTELTLEECKGFLPENILQALDAITKREGEQYRDYILRVKANPLATKVKLKDIEHNMWKNREIQDSYRLRMKYIRANMILTNKTKEF